MELGLASSILSAISSHDIGAIRKLMARLTDRLKHGSFIDKFMIFAAIGIGTPGVSSGPFDHRLARFYSDLQYRFFA
jgi:hypothetical protein